jgi:hypothetical protein
MLEARRGRGRGFGLLEFSVVLLHALERVRLKGLKDDRTSCFESLAVAVADFEDSASFDG